jgi:hypothetical protein
MPDHKRNDTKDVYLSPWVEIIGVFHGLIVNKTAIRLNISDMIVTLPYDSVEAHYVQDILTDAVIDHTIAVLRTDLPDKPIFIRVVD